MRFTKILGAAGVITLAALGAQVVATQVASAHTPRVALTCSTWSVGATNYQTNQDNTYSYSLDGAAPVAASFGAQFSDYGTFADGSGNHTLVGYVYQDNLPGATYSRTFDLSTEGCSTFVPIPAAPLPNAPTCAEAGSPAIPADTDTVHWSLTGNVATATAQGANLFTDGTSTKTFTETVLPKLSPETEGCAVPVTAQAPVITNGDCDTAPSLTGAIDGIGYTASTEGTPGFGNTVTVTFTGTANYRLDGQTVYTFRYAAQPDCLADVSPVAPGITQSTCAVSGVTAVAPTLTVLDTPNVSYALPLGPYAAPSTVIVTATAASGYEFTSAGLPAGWTLVGSDSIAATATYSVDFAPAPLCGTAAEATFHDDVCRADGATGASYTLVSSTEVEYHVDGIETAAGTHPAADGSTVTITAQPRPGYTLVGTTSWSHTFSAVPNCAHVSATNFVLLPPASQPTAAAATTVALASTGVATMRLLLIAGLLAVVGGALCLGGRERRSSRS